MAGLLRSFDDDAPVTFLFSAVKIFRPAIYQNDNVITSTHQPCCLLEGGSELWLFISLWSCVVSRNDHSNEEQRRPVSASMFLCRTTTHVLRYFGKYFIVIELLLVFWFALVSCGGGGGVVLPGALVAACSCDGGCGAGWWWRAAAARAPALEGSQTILEIMNGFVLFRTHVRYFGNILWSFWF